MPARRPTGPEKSPEQRWDEAASHRKPAETNEASADTGARASVDPAHREAFLNTRDGAFYPTGHAVLVLSPDDAHELREALARHGVANDEMLLLTPQEAAAVMRDSEQEAGLLAELVGAEMKNVQVMRQLADAGSAFLIVRVEDDEQERSLVAAARHWRVQKALRYHTLAIEELRVGTEEIPGDSPYGVNEVLRSKPSDARLKRRH